MNKTFHMGRLMIGVCLGLIPVAFGQDAHNEKLNSALMKYTLVIQSIPQHPLSAEALDVAQKVFLDSGAKSEEAALQSVIEALPNSRLGMYALEKLLDKSKNAKSLAQELMQSHVDNAVGAFALNYLLEHAPDPLALCYEIAVAHPNTRLSAFVSTRLGDNANAQGKFAQAEAFYLQAGMRALPKLGSLWKEHNQWIQGMFFPNAPGWPMPSAQSDIFAFAKANAHTLWETDNPEQDAFNEALWQVEAKPKSIEYFMRNKGAYPWQWQAFATLMITKKHIKEGRVLVTALTLEYLYSLLPDTTQPDADYVLPCVAAYMFAPPAKFDADMNGQFSASLERVMEEARLQAIQGQLLELTLRSLPLLSPGIQAHFLHLIAMRQAATIDPLEAAKTLEKVAQITGVDEATLALTNTQIEKLKSGEWKHDTTAAKQ